MHLSTKLKQQAQEDFTAATAAEEAEMMKEKQQEMIDRARFLALQQDDRVRQFNRMLQNRYVLCENEALIKFHQEEKRIAQEQKRQYDEEIRSRQEEYVKQKKEKARLKQLSNQALAAYRAKQIRENREIREKQMQQEKEEGERIRRMGEYYAQEELRNHGRQRIDLRKTDSKKREMGAGKLDLKEDKKLRGQFDLEHKILQKQNDKAEKFKNHQLLIENVRDKLAVRLKEQAAAKARKEKEIISQALAKQNALVSKKQREEEEKRAAMIKSIASHRQRVIQEKKQKEQAEQKRNLDWLEAQKEAARRFHQEKAQKAQRAREAAIECRKVNKILIAQQQAHAERLKWDEDEAESRTARRLAERDEDIEQYIERELLVLAEKTEGHGFHGNCKEPGCSCKKTPQYMSGLAHDQMRHIKQYLDCERPPLSAMTKDPPPLPPLVYKSTLDTTAKGF